MSGYADVISVSWEKMRLMEAEVLKASSNFGTLQGELHQALRPLVATWTASGSAGGEAAKNAEDELALAFQHYGQTLGRLANALDAACTRQQQNEISYANAFGGNNSSGTALV